MTERESLWPWLLRLWRHLWQSERAAWQAVPDDMVDRLRKSTGLGVTRVVVRPEEARAAGDLPADTDTARLASLLAGAATLARAGRWPRRAGAR